MDEAKAESTVGQISQNCAGRADRKLSAVWGWSSGGSALEGPFHKRNRPGEKPKRKGDRAGPGKSVGVV